MSNPTRDGNRAFWGQILVTRPDRVDDAQLDADVASQRRNIESHLGLIGCVADTGGVRRRWLFGKRWEQLEAPTLLLWGDRDRFASPNVGAELAARNRNVRLLRMPDAGHLPWFDEPEVVTEEIARFTSTAAEAFRPLDPTAADDPQTKTSRIAGDSSE